MHYQQLSRLGFLHNPEKIGEVVGYVDLTNVWHACFSQKVELELQIWRDAARYGRLYLLHVAAYSAVDEVRFIIHELRRLSQDVHLSSVMVVDVQAFSKIFRFHHHVLCLVGWAHSLQLLELLC